MPSAIEETTKEETINKVKKRLRWRGKERNPSEDHVLEYERVWCTREEEATETVKTQNRVEMICLQETIKANFFAGELARISEGGNFEWVWTDTQGHSGGTLIGVKTDNITVLSKDRGEFFSSMKITSRQDNAEWEVVNVYGPLQLERKAEFLTELGQKIATMNEHFIIGGDFNLIRFSWESPQIM